VLFIDDQVPLFHVGSGAPRAAEMLKALPALNGRVTFYPLQFPAAPWPAVFAAGFQDVEIARELGRPGLADFLRARRDDCDVIIVSRPHNMATFNQAMAQLGAEAPRATLVYDAEALYASRDVLRRVALGEPADAAEAEAAMRDELHLAASAQVVLTVSPAEAARFQSAGCRRVEVLSHAVRLQPSPTPFDRRHGFLFVGPLDNDLSPNVDSIVWFIREVFPRLRQALGERASLRLVGACRSPRIQALSLDGVEIMGRVPDLTGHYEQARVFIAPTRFSAGIPLKVIDAAAHQLPVVATPTLGAQLGWRDGEELLLAADAEAFAERCLALHTDQALWAALRERAAGAIAKQFSPEGFRATLAAAIR
jgi:glycosyltransferase involved in cell wall biosynthesis